jgi:hypothetical protein
MNRTAITASAGAVAALALVAVGGAGYLAGNSHAAGRVVTRTVTVTKTSPPKIVTRWKTRTETRTVTVTATPSVDNSQLASANACIADLYQDIEGWITISGSSVGSYQGGTATIPAGWWDGRCPVP